MHEIASSHHRHEHNKTTPILRTANTVHKANLARLSASIHYTPHAHLDKKQAASGIFAGITCSAFTTTANRDPVIRCTRVLLTSGIFQDITGTNSPARPKPDPVVCTIPTTPLLAIHKQHVRQGPHYTPRLPPKPLGGTKPLWGTKPLGGTHAGAMYWVLGVGCR